MLLHLETTGIVFVLVLRRHPVDLQCFIRMCVYIREAIYRMHCICVYRAFRMRVPFFARRCSHVYVCACVCARNCMQMYILSRIPRAKIMCIYRGAPAPARIMPNPLPFSSRNLGRAHTFMSQSRSLFLRPFEAAFCVLPK